MDIQDLKEITFYGDNSLLNDTSSFNEESKGKIKLKALKGRVRIRAWQKNPLFPDDRTKDVLIYDRITDNLIVNVGKDSILKRLGGTGLSGHGEAGSIGVGDNATAVSSSNTDLIATTNKLWKSIVSTDKTYIRPTLYLSATFGFSDANWTWNEIGLCDNQFANPAAGALLWARQIDGTPLVKDTSKRAIVEWQLSL